MYEYIQYEGRGSDIYKYIAYASISEGIEAEKDQMPQSTDTKYKSCKLQIRAQPLNTEK